MRDRQRLVHVLLDQEYGDAALVDLANDVEVVLDQQWRQPERRLVDQQELWRPHQSAANRYHRLLTARHGASKLRAALGQPGKHAIDLRHALVRDGVRGFLVGAEAQIVLNGELRKYLASFRDARDARSYDLVCRQSGDVGSVEHDLPGAWRRQSENGTDQRRFTRAVRSEKAG